jgi:hypothetical protein
VNGLLHRARFAAYQLYAVQQGHGGSLLGGRGRLSRTDTVVMGASLLILEVYNEIRYAHRFGIELPIWLLDVSKDVAALPTAAVVVLLVRGGDEEYGRLY